jgi:catechol 2,3-dioxygenase-like lactoylglutathione lyase family enzyme
MTVENLDRTVNFYRNVLGFQQVAEHNLAGPEYERLTGLTQANARIARMQLGAEYVDLVEYLNPRGARMPPDSRSNDHWFQHVAIIVRNLDEAYARLCCFSVEHASIQPQRLPDWNAAAGGIRAFYFRDPDGHFLEILQFPPEKGLSKWHEPATRQFLGIDHTAIVVASTTGSLHFYRDLLGMQVTGESENFGIEQERLTGVTGARVRITTLRAPAGAGIELLEYISPRDGRQRPIHSRPNDIMHWHTTVSVANFRRTLNALRAAEAPILSADIARNRAGGLPRPSVLVGDPDGHVIELTEAPRMD